MGLVLLLGPSIPDVPHTCALTLEKNSAKHPTTTPTYLPNLASNVASTEFNVKRLNIGYNEIYTLKFCATLVLLGTNSNKKSVSFYVIVFG